MDRQSSIDLILDHYENPRNSGVLENPALDGQQTNAGCGDVIRITAQLDADQRITRIAFEGQGCTISQAAASIFTELALNRLLPEILERGEEELVSRMGEHMVTQRINCVTLALRALHIAANGNAA